MSDKAPKRLSFLKELVKSQGVTQKELANRLGVTPQRVNMIFGKEDDCFLARACEIAEAVGYKLSVELLPSENRPEEEPVTINLQDYQYEGVAVKIKGDVQVKNKPAYSYPSYISDCPKDKRLYFLACFIKEVNIPLFQICGELGLSSSAFNYTFKNDNILVSNIHKIASTYHMDVVWSIEKLPEAPGVD